MILASGWFYETKLCGAILHQINGTSLPVSKSRKYISICGDFNSRCGDASDYIEGVDEVRDRDVIDFTSNHYGDLLLDVLIDCNFWMLNG